MRRMLATVLALGGTTALTLGAAPALGAASIEGVWQYGDGSVLVEPAAGGGWTGTVTKETNFAGCSHPVGQKMWAITGGTDPDFTGTHLWFANQSTCAAGGFNPGPATWHVDLAAAGGPSLRLCTADPGSGQPVTLDAAGNPTGTTQCNTLRRLAPPAPPPTFAQAVQLPATRTCRSRRSFRIHVRQGNDPFVKAIVKVNTKTVATLIGAANVSAPANLRGLPKGRYTVSLTLTTATGRVVNGTRHYRTCVPRHR